MARLATETFLGTSLWSDIVLNRSEITLLRRAGELAGALREMLPKDAVGDAIDFDADCDLGGIEHTCLDLADEGRIRLSDPRAYGCYR